MAKRQPFDTNLSFPPAPTRALLSTPLDGIIGGPAPRTEPPPDAALHHEVVAPPVHMSIEPEPLPVAIYVPPPVEIAEPRPSPAALAPGQAADIADVRLRESTTRVERSEPIDDGKVTVKLPPDLKNRLYNAIYAERGTVGDYLTRAVEDLIDQLERDRGGPYPQRPRADEKFRAGRRPR
jgi:hypothetical protein